MPDAPAIDFLAHLRSESARFAEVLAASDPTARVPSCPDWDADDLLWHLAEVQWFWGSIVQDLVTDAAEAEALTATRPEGRAALQVFYDAASAELADALASHADDVPAWTWSSDQSVGFIRRRQAHEALIHRVDAELTAGSRTPLDRDLSRRRRRRGAAGHVRRRPCRGARSPPRRGGPCASRPPTPVTRGSSRSAASRGPIPTVRTHDEPDLSVLPAADGHRAARSRGDRRVGRRPGLLVLAPSSAGRSAALVTPTSSTPSTR